MATKKKSAAAALPVGGEDANYADLLLTKSNARINQELNETRARDPFAGRVQVTRDAEDKALFDQHLDDDLEFEETPLETVKRQYGREGMSLKLMSDRVTNHNGGTQGYQVVTDPKGNPVKVGSMTLGEIPERIAKGRTRRSQRRATEEIRDIRTSFSDRVAALKKEAKDLGHTVSAIESGSTVDNIGGGSFEMGISVNRGDTPADV